MAAPIVGQIGSDPTWKDDTYEIADVDPATGQIATVNTVTGECRVLTDFDSRDRWSPWVWVAPETGAEAAFVCNTDSGCIQFYFETGDAAGPSKQLCAEEFGADALIITPELFVLRRRSYVTFLVETAVSSDVYVAGAVDFPLQEPYLGRTSSDELRRRRDPEPVVRWIRGYIYYTALTDGQASGFGVWQTLVQGRPRFDQSSER